MSEELDIDEMVEDIYGQNHPRKPKDLRDIPQYQNAISADDFDITYRTPKDLIENPNKQNIRKHILPNEYMFVNDLDEYDKHIAKTHNLPYKKPATPDQEVIGLYDRDIDMIIAGPDTDNATLAHEFFHKKHRNTEKQRARVMTEPTFKGFNYKNSKQIQNDYIKTMGTHWKGLTKKERQKQVKLIEKSPYYEQLAEFSEFPLEIANPKTKTGKVINRLWFE
jgi:hypothetical protein